MRQPWVLLPLLLLVFGCSDDSGPKPDMAVSDQAIPDGGADVVAPDQGPPPGPLTVTVLKADGMWKNDFTTQPADGVTVAADLPGGDREEQTTGADGKVTFAKVEWARGTAAITAYAKGYRLTSVIGLTSADGDQTLYLAPLRPSVETVEISGTAKNPDPGGDYLVVCAVGAVEAFQGPKTLSYNIPVPKDQATTLLGIQAKDLKPTDLRLFPLGAVAWTKLDVPASSTDTTVDLDFANKETPTAFSTTFELPTAPDSLVGTASRPEVYVNSYDGLLLGIPRQSTKLSTTKFTVDAEYVKLAPEADVLTRYFVFVGANGHGSFIIEQGYPKDGATVKDFLEVPTLVYPPSTTATAPYYDRIEIENPDPTAEPVAVIVDESEGQIFWMLRGAKGMTSLTFPPLPTTASAADVFGASKLYAQPGMVADWDTTRLMYKRFSNGPWFPVDPTPPTASCVDKTYDGHAYKFCDELPWAGGVTVCKSHGMRLARVDDDKENEWIETTALDVLAVPASYGLWLGGNDQQKEGTWAWPDGAVFYQDGAAKLFKKWNVGEPNNYGNVEDCLMMYLGSDELGYWNDDDCSKLKYVVCEKY